MSEQFLRVVQLVVGKAGKGILIEGLKIEFDIKKTSTEEPNSAEIRIYNLAQSTADKIRKEYTEVIVNAGYKNATRLIFRGNVQRAFTYREQNDKITSLLCGDGDADYHQSVVNTTLAAGSTQEQIVKALSGTFKNGTKVGSLTTSTDTLLRGKVLSGDTRKYLREVAKSSGAQWSIQDGSLHIVPVGKTLPNRAVIITGATGMLGSAEANDKGVKVKCLLNPEIVVYGVIKLDNDSIKPQALPKSSTGDDLPREAPAKLAKDGLYKVVKLTHKGTNRGQDWITEVEAIAL